MCIFNYLSNCSLVFHWIIVVLIHSLFGCSVMIDENITSSSDKIIEGTYESKELSVLGLVYAGQIKCTGTLIAPRTELTDAHCIYVQSNQMLTLPENVVVVDDQRWIDFANVIDYAIHPNWT